MGSLADLHPLELLAVLGGLVAATLALLVPDSRARFAAAWVLLGTVVAAAVAAGPRPLMYPVYLLAIVTILAAWSASRRLRSSPVRRVWRSGRGSDDEAVPEAAGPVRSTVSVLLFLVALVLLAVPLGLLPLPAIMLGR